jgi:hypothetical protein
MAAKKKATGKRNSQDATLRNVRAARRREREITKQVAAVALSVMDLAETVRRLEALTAEAFADVKQRLWKVERRSNQIKPKRMDAR